MNYGIMPRTFTLALTLLFATTLKGDVSEVTNKLEMLYIKLGTLQGNLESLKDALTELKKEAEYIPNPKKSEPPYSNPVEKKSLKELSPLNIQFEIKNFPPEDFANLDAEKDMNTIHKLALHMSDEQLVALKPEALIIAVKENAFLWDKFPALANALNDDSSAVSYTNNAMKKADEAAVTVYLSNIGSVNATNSPTIKQSNLSYPENKSVASILAQRISPEEDPDQDEDFDQDDEDDQVPQPINPSITPGKRLVHKNKRLSSMNTVNIHFEIKNFPPKDFAKLDAEKDMNTIHKLALHMSDEQLVALKPEALIIAVKENASLWDKFPALANALNDDSSAVSYTNNAMKNADEAAVRVYLSNIGSVNTTNSPTIKQSNLSYPENKSVASILAQRISPEGDPDQDEDFDQGDEDDQVPQPIDPSITPGKRLRTKKSVIADNTTATIHIKK